MTKIPEPTSQAVPPVGSGKRGSEGHIGYLLRQAHAAHRQRMEQALAPHAITLPQFSVLLMLTSYPGASGAELARLSLVTPQTINVILSNLERDGAIERRRHTTHGRIQTNHSTFAGAELLARCKRSVEAVERRLLEEVDPADEIVVRRWLVRAALGSVGHEG